MKQPRPFIPAFISFVIGSSIIGYACNHVLPVIVRREAAKLPPRILRDTVNVIDTPFSPPGGSLTVSLFFSAGNASFSPKQQQKLLDGLRSIPFSGKRVAMLSGYADEIGSTRSDDIALALQRSAAVCTFLIQNGIAKDKIYLRPWNFVNDSLKNRDSRRKIDVSLSEEIYQ